MLQPTAQTSQWSGKTILVISPTPTHPQDYGNRKRVFRVCKMLQRAGAKIHFVHYASESEWRNAIPEQAQTDMMREWDGYYLVTPTRWLHTSPEGEHHQIDDWWDGGLEPMIKWLSEKLMVDACIVNYTWLSKALEFVPNHVLKILDTHDKFSGRKELLESYGLNPEFFYVTEESEKIGFERADIIWAIKNEEELIFREMTSKQVTTVPHADVFEPIRASGRIDEHEMVFGIMGAKNNINVLNTTRFLEAAAPIFKEHLAPVKILIGGTVCELLDHIELPFVEKIGWVDDTREFYEQIDVALIPMEFSTGLKIKTAEGLSFGMPIVSHKHAFEGYKPYHDFHSLGSFTDIAEACVDLATGEHSLEELRVATAASYRAVVDNMENGVGKTGDLLKGERDKTLIVIGDDAVSRGTIAQSAFRGYSEYLSYRGPIAVFVEDASNDSELLRFCLASRGKRIYINDKIQARIGETKAKMIEEAGGRWSSLKNLRQQMNVRFLWLDAAPKDIQVFEGDTIERIYLNLGQMPEADARSLLDIDLNEATDAFTRVTLLLANDSVVASELRKRYGADTVFIPPFWSKNFAVAHEMVDWNPPGRYGVNLILPKRSPAIERFIAKATKLGGDRLINIVIADGEPVDNKIVYRDDIEYRFFPISEVEGRKREQLRNAKLTISFAERGGPAERLMETLYAARHHIVEPLETEQGASRRSPKRLWTLLNYVTDIVSGARKVDESRLDRNSASDNDAGWTRIWGHAS